MRVNSTISEVIGSSAFRATRSPYLLLDRDLHILAVNPAYESATGQSADALLETHMFEAFPDNPQDPYADGVVRLSASFDFVLRRGTRHWMGVQRYDVPSARKRGQFVRKVWAPVNSPICSVRGKTIAILHHVEDITAALDDHSPDARTGTLPDQRIDGDPARQQTANGSDDAVALGVALEVLRAAYEQIAEDRRRLQDSFQADRKIGTAVGLLMAEHHISDQEAFVLILTRSQQSRRRIRDVAHDIVNAAVERNATTEL